MLRTRGTLRKFPARASRGADAEYADYNFLTGDLPDDDGEADPFAPDPREIIENMMLEAVEKIEDGEKAETIIYCALEAAYNFGFTQGQERPF